MTAAPAAQSPTPEPPTAAPQPATLSPEPASTPEAVPTADPVSAPEPVAPTAVVGMSTVPSAPTSWPVSAAPYGVMPVLAAPPRRGQASMVILSIVSTLLLVGVGVLTVLYINDRQTISQQRSTIDSSAADLKATSAELDKTKKDLDSTKKDLDTEKACADTVRDFVKQMQSLAAGFDPTTGIDTQSIATAVQAITTKCGISG